MRLALLKVPYHLGRARVQVGCGPEPLARWAAHYLDGQDVAVHAIESPAEPANEIGATFDLNARVAHLVRSVVSEGVLPIVLGGNCNVCLGTVAGLGAVRTGVVWFDAHGDFNTPETTLTGFFDGMALATATGHAWTTLSAGIPGFRPVLETDVLLIGGRSLDPAERALLDTTSIRRLTETQLRSGGLDGTLRQLPTDPLYVHIDLDVLDPRELCTNRWAVPGGLTIDELRAALATIAQRGRIAAVSLTSYDPAFDPDGCAQWAVEGILEGILAGRRP